MQWAALSEDTIHVRQHGDEIDADREETRAKFKKYFDASGMRGFYSRPLNDDTGRVGMLAMEASDPDFLGPAHIEILEVLAGQATVALRNAQMYKEVPFHFAPSTGARTKAKINGFAAEPQDLIHRTRRSGAAVSSCLSSSPARYMAMHLLHRCTRHQYQPEVGRGHQQRARP